MTHSNHNSMRRSTLRKLTGLGMGTILTAGAGAAAVLAPFNSFAKSEAKAAYRFRFGTIYTPSAAEYTAPGIYDFVERVQRKSDGEIAIQLIDKAQACSEDQCAQRVMSGILHMGSSTFQNTGATMPYSVALDWPFLWKSRVAYHNFLLSKESNRLYRDVLRNKYGVVPLYASGSMRNIMMGKKYSEAADITSPDALNGAKIRITNSEMISNFAKSMGMAPIPLAWGELLEGLKSGLVDATETYPSAAAGFGMHSVLSQDIDVQFCPGYSMIFMAAKTFDKLPERLQELIYESAYESMVEAYQTSIIAESTLVGIGPNPSPDSAYQRGKIRQIKLSHEQHAAFKESGSVENNSQLYANLRKQLDDIAGIDVYGALSEYAKNTSSTELMAEKWWT